LSEQCEIHRDASGTPIIQIKATTEISCESLQHPADPDSSYNAYKGQGYAVQIMETYTEDHTAPGATPTEQSQPDLITHVAVHKMTQHDSQALAPAIADVRSRQRCPTQLLGDSHYGSTESIAQCHREGIALVAPAMPPKGSKQGQLALEDFHLDVVGRVVACPQGHPPVWTSVSETKLAVRFDPVLCQACPNMPKCPGAAVGAQPKKDGRWQYTHERVAQCHRRLAEQEPAFKAQYRWRAGIEATMSRLKHQMRLAHLRVRGMAAVCYTVFLRALGLNVLRVAAYQ
jgi:Transposase DDE domain